MAHQWKKAFTALSLLTLGAGTLTACSSASAEPNFVTVNGTEPQQPLIPANTNENGGGRVVNMLYSGLVYHDANGVVHNELAENIELEGDRTYQVTLKPDLTFADGSPLTSHSFVDAWNYAVEHEQLTASFFKPIKGYESGVKELEGLKVIDDRHFSIELSDPDESFISRMAYNAFFPLPEAAFEDMAAFGENPVGNGPYKFSEWRHNESLSLVPNENYAGERTPKNDGLRYVFYQRPDAAYADLLAGELDVLDLIPSSAFDTYEQELDGRSVNQPGAMYLEMSIRWDTEHFAGEEGNLRRRAVSMAINRPEINDKIFRGTRTPARDFTSPALDGWDGNIPGVENLEYNPEKAKELWAQADQIQPFSGELLINYNVDGDNQAWADAVANNITNVLGIPATGNPYPDFKSFRDEYRTGHMPGAYRTAWFADYPSLGNFLGPNFRKGNPSNDAQYDNPEFDALLDKAAQAKDTTEANKIYNQAQEHLLRDLPAIPLFYPNIVGGWSEHVSDVTFNWKGLPEYYAVNKASK